MQDQEIELIRQDRKEGKPIRRDHVRQQGEFSLPIRWAHENLFEQFSSVLTARGQERPISRIGAGPISILAPFKKRRS